MEQNKKTWKLTADEKREIFERSALGEPPSQIKESYSQISLQAISQLVSTNQDKIRETRERLLKDIPLSDRAVRILLRQKRYYRLEQLIKAGDNKNAFVELEKLQSEELRKIAEEMGLKTGVSVSAQAQAGLNLQQDITYQATIDKSGRVECKLVDPREKEDFGKEK